MSRKLQQDGLGPVLKLEGKKGSQHWKEKLRGKEETVMKSVMGKGEWDVNMMSLSVSTGYVNQALLFLCWQETSENPLANYLFP